MLFSRLPGADCVAFTDGVTIKAADERLPSGVLNALDPGLSPTVKDLLTLMIVISDNEATDLLAECAEIRQPTSHLATAPPRFSKHSGHTI